MIEVFIIGVILGLALGVVLGSLRKTSKELEESEAIDRLIENQDLIIYRQNETIEELKSGKLIIRNGGIVKNERRI